MASSLPEKHVGRPWRDAAAPGRAGRASTGIFVGHVEWVGVARAISPLVRSGHPALRSLHASSLRHPASRSLARPARWHGQPRPLTLSHIKAPGASPGTAGTNATPRSMSPRVTWRYAGRVWLLSSWCATSQSPSSRRGLLCRTGRAQRNGNPASRSLARPARWHGQPRPLTLSHIKAPGASPGTAGTKATLRSMSPRVTWRHAVRAWLFPMGVPRRSPPARAGGFYWQRTPRSTRRAAHAVRHTPGRGWP